MSNIVKEKTVESSAKIVNVIFAWSYIQWGGAQIYDLSIIRNAPLNWRFTLLIPRNSKPDLLKFFEPCGVETAFIDASLYEGPVDTIGRKIKRQWQRIKSELALYFALRKYDPLDSVIHIDAAPWQSWILLYMLTRRHQVFVTLHNAIATNIPKWRAGVWKKRLRFLSSIPNFHLFAANQDTIDSMREYLAEKDVAKITLTRATINPIEIEKVAALAVDRRSIRRKNGISEDKFLVLCLGQFIDRKGRWIFMEAAREILKQPTDVVFVWITPQPATTDELEKIDGYGLGESFRLILSADLGPTREDVLSFFRVADVFALASFWEGLPISILEAMALGTPTISTSVNAIPEAVRDRETGILIEPGNSRALADAILTLRGNKELREKLARDGREFVLANFDERVAASLALREYEKALKDPSRN